MIRRDDVQKMLSALAGELPSDNFFMEFRIVNNWIMEIITGFTEVISNLTHGHQLGTYWPFEPYRDIVASFNHLLGDWARGGEMNMGRFFKITFSDKGSELVSLLIFQEKTEQLGVSLKEKLEMEKKIVARRALWGIIEVWARVEEHGYNLEPKNLISSCGDKVRRVWSHLVAINAMEEALKSSVDLTDKELEKIRSDAYCAGPWENDKHFYIWGGAKALFEK